ncbi:chlorophyll(ide) b reductase chloroplastic [Micractinium conductrix]|uniref:Chlorophyll(Ide) b reductase chloroplastic n=1 Tax=Micractinium conductrix TaxID=554055 RepID=A0A2P6VI12_9CHLO|nr:chlorophyll(ide) b reductase chloroplastic [Micractinium conductrix]|eukprot:PSC73722.1 chlorophyll(ide) b reductase chloroplastic [Micractinium conductrix]
MSLSASTVAGLDWRAFALGCITPAALVAAAKLARGARAALSVRADSQQGEPGLKVVITGGTRGLGFQLARAFLALGDDVCISGRAPGAVEAAAAKLRSEFPRCTVVGVPADAARDAEALSARAAAELGHIDVWINYAALSAERKAPVSSSPAGELAAIVETNLTGALLGARAAIMQMQRQPGGGRVFLVDGNGSWGNATPGNAAYGAAKRGLVQLKDSLVAETAGTGVGVHIISPGMVATDLLMRYADNARSARMINILAEDPAEVAAWLVPRMRGARGSGSYIRYLTMPGVVWRFLTSSRRRGRFVPEGSAAAGYARLPAQAAG